MNHAWAALPFKYEIAWTARAIFKPWTEWPIDLLGDRMHWSGLAEGQDPPASLELLVHQGITQLKEWSKYLEGSSSEIVLKTYPYETNRHVVLRASPNGSCGYLYISVSLLAVEELPPIPELVEPVALVRERNSEKEQFLPELIPRIVPFKGELKRARAAKLQHKKEIQARIAAATEANGALQVGDHLHYYCQGAKRDAFCIDVDPDNNEAVIEYWLPSLKKYTIIVDRTLHTKLHRTYKGSDWKRSGKMKTG